MPLYTTILLSPAPASAVAAADNLHHELQALQVKHSLHLNIEMIMKLIMTNTLV